MSSYSGWRLPEAAECEVDEPVVDEPVVLTTREEIAERLRQTFASRGYEPPVLPRIALELMKLSRQPKVPLHQLEQILVQDPTLTGQILKCCNRPRFGARAPIRSVRAALMRLGIPEVCNQVLRISMKSRVFRAPGWEGEVDAVIRHSEAVATYASAVARLADQDAPYAYLCGLMHDLGLIAALIALADQHAGARPDLELAWPALLEVHEGATRLVAEAWELPPELVDVVADHHQPDLAFVGERGALIAGLVVAELLAQQEGAGLNVPGASDFAAGELLVRRACLRLDLQGKLPQVVKAAKATAGD